MILLNFTIKKKIENANLQFTNMQAFIINTINYLLKKIMLSNLVNKLLGS